VALGLRVRGVPAARRVELVGYWLESLGLADVRRQYPWQLSGGQRQRVAVARSLVLEPDLLLMGEPSVSLDALTREDLQELVLGLMAASTRRLTAVLVTHDVAEAVLLGRGGGGAALAANHRRPGAREPIGRPAGLPAPNRVPREVPGGSGRSYPGSRAEQA
jgi:ABC-type nitrate/sulfonate/bicarbonate transport system ATPase subunit